MHLGRNRRWVLPWNFHAFIAKQLQGNYEKQQQQSENRTMNTMRDAWLEHNIFIKQTYGFRLSHSLCHLKH